MYENVVVLDGKMDFMKVLEGAVQFGTPVLFQVTPSSLLALTNCLVNICCYN